MSTDLNNVNNEKEPRSQKQGSLEKRELALGSEYVEYICVFVCKSVGVY